MPSNADAQNNFHGENCRIGRRPTYRQLDVACRPVGRCATCAYNSRLTTLRPFDNCYATTRRAQTPLDTRSYPGPFREPGYSRDSGPCRFPSPASRRLVLRIEADRDKSQIAERVWMIAAHKFHLGLHAQLLQTRLPTAAPYGTARS